MFSNSHQVVPQTLQEDGTAQKETPIDLQPVAESDSESDANDHDVEEDRKPVDTEAKNALLKRLSTGSNLLQQRKPRYSVIQFKQMISDEKPVEVVVPKRISVMAPSTKIPSTKIRSFDVIKAIYVFLLLPIHLTNLTNWVSGNDAYISSMLPYKTTDHGQEYIMVIYLK